MLNRPPLWITAVAALTVGLSACTGGSAKTAKSAPPSPSTSSSPTSSASPTTETTTAQPAPRTVAVLKSALLELGDLPTGFAIEPASGADDGVGASSKDAKCAALVKLFNSKTAPGSKATSHVSFSGGQDGPFVEESIDALRSADAVETLQASFKSAIAACPRMTVTISGQGSSTMKVAAVAAPQFGEHPVAVRFTASGGSLAGLELTQVTTGVGDVVLALSFLLAAADDVDSATKAAAGKAQNVLGVSAPSA